MYKKIQDEINKIVKDISYVLYLIHDSYSGNERIKDGTTREINERIDTVQQDAYRLTEIAKDIEWENRTTKKFQYFNTALLIFPTIAAIALVIFTLNRNTYTQKKIIDLNSITALDSSIIQKQGEIISYQDSSLSHFRRNVMAGINYKDTTLLFKAEKELDVLIRKKSIIEESLKR